MPSQHGEDNIIDGLLNNPSEGFYIDVGAHSPHHESVTLSFYERGWHGINIEPQEHYYNELCTHRPRDTNLNLALGDQAGLQNFWLGDGLSTFVQPFARGEWPCILVEVRTLKQVCDQYLGNHQAIDFLKIDVEGYEKQVIFGGNWEKYRPKVLCIEATIPMTETDYNVEEWEPFLFNAGYQFMTKDMVNRYYLRK